jgi:rare lipoprotein A (peptidoglycan hydrolase)
METAQVQQLKLNATNIKSVLIRSNVELRKIKLQRKDLVNSQIDKEKKKEKEKKLESGIKSSLNKVKNAVFTGPMNIFDKIMEFAGIILLGILVNNLPTIISKLEEFFKENSAFINGVIQVIKFIGSGIASLSGLVSNLSSGKQNQIASDRKKIDEDLGGLKQQLGDVSSKTNEINKAINSKKKPSPTPPPKKGQEPLKRAKGGLITSRQPQTTKSTSPAFTAGETGRAKRARQTTNYFGTFNQAVKDSSENSITDQDNLGLFEKMANNFKKFSEFMQTSMRSPLDTQSPDGGGGSPPGGGIPIDVDPDEVIGKVGYTGRVVPSGPDGSHIHIEKVGGGSIPSDIKNNIYVSGLPMPSRLRFTSGIGWRWGRMHKGEDFAGDPDQPITLRGGLKFVKYLPDNGSGYGNRVIIQSADGKSEYTLNHLNAGPTNAKELAKRQNKNQQNLANFNVKETITGKQASWYGPGFYGNKTASGQIYTGNDLTAAHNTLPFGSYVRVTNLNNNKTAIVRINDRGPFEPDGKTPNRTRIIDLSRASADALGVSGVSPITLEVLTAKAKVTPPPSTANKPNQQQQLLASMAQVPQSSIILGIQPVQNFVPIMVPTPVQSNSTTTLLQTPPPSALWGN